MAQFLPGWYDDGSGTQRYWDGVAWTAHTAPPASSVPVAPSLPPVIHPTPGPADPVTGTRTRRIWPWILVCVGVLVVLISVGVWVLISVLGQASARPEDAVREYTNAWWDADCDQIEATTTPAWRDTYEEAGEPFTCDNFAQTSAEYYGDAEDLGLEVTSVTVTNGTAVVEVVETMTVDGTATPNSWEYALVQGEGGRWLVDAEEDLTIEE